MHRIYIVIPFAFGTLVSQRKHEKLYWDCTDVMLKFEKENSRPEEPPLCIHTVETLSKANN